MRVSMEFKDWARDIGRQVCQLFNTELKFPNQSRQSGPISSNFKPCCLNFKPWCFKPGLAKKSFWLKKKHETFLKRFFPKIYSFKDRRKISNLATFSVPSLFRRSECTEPIAEKTHACGWLNHEHRPFSIWKIFFLENGSKTVKIGIRLFGKQIDNLKKVSKNTNVFFKLGKTWKLHSNTSNFQTIFAHRRLRRLITPH